jgi:hypothetical protein
MVGARTGGRPTCSLETRKGSVQHVRFDCARNEVKIQQLADIGPLCIVKSVKCGVGFQVTDQPTKALVDVDPLQEVLGCRIDEARILVLELLAKVLVPLPWGAEPDLRHRL